MKRVLFISSVVLIFQSCLKCDMKDYFPLPDRVKYNAMTEDAFERYVVIDSAMVKYIRLDDYTGTTANILPFYDSLFLKERIHSIDFGDSSTAKLNIFSYGKLNKVIKSSYAKNQSTVTVFINGSPGNNYFNLFINSGSVISIPYVMSFSKKMGQPNLINNVVADNGEKWINKSDIIQNQISNAHLNMNDTVYINKINLIYYPY